MAKKSKLARNGIQIVALGMDPVAAPPTKAEPKIPPPVQEPITNFYTDKVVEKEALVQFLGKAFEAVRGPRDAATYIGQLVGSSAYTLTPYGSGCQHDQKFIARHKAFFDSAFNLDPSIGADIGERHYLGYVIRSGKPVTDENWMLIRDLLRFAAWDYMISPEVRKTMMVAGESLFREGIDGAREIIWQRKRLPYYKELSTKFKLEIDPRHFLHMSPRNNAFIRFTPDEKSRERDLVVETTISKYLRKYHPSLTDAQLRDIAELHKFLIDDDGILLFDKPEDIAKVYRNGPPSCMGKDDVHFRSPVHPASMYGNSPGVKLAALPPDDSGRYPARCFIYTSEDGKDKRFIRLYGDSLLQRRLEKKGYVPGSWKGVKLRKLPFLDKHGKPLPGTYVMPYIDDIYTGNGTSGAAQWGYTNDSVDYILIGSQAYCNEAYRAAGNKGEVFSCAVTQGSIGRHIDYNPLRHNSWAVRLAGGPYNEPSVTSINKWDEFRCLVCNGVFDQEHARPLFRSESNKTPEHRICPNCRENGTYIDIGWEGKPAYTNIANVVLLDKQTLDVDRITRIKGIDREKYHILFPKQLKEYGLVQLMMLPSMRNVQYAKLEDAEEIEPDCWVKKADVIHDVFGKRTTKHNCYFFGQSSTGVLQYFPKSNPVIREALAKGKFVILGGKIEYIEKTFSARKRKDYFAAIGELDEEEDDAPLDVFEQTIGFTKPIPMLDVINCIWAYLTVLEARNGRVASTDAIFYVLQRFAPRANADILYTMAYSIPVIKSDPYAGVEGIPGISNQIATALAHGYLEDGDIETDKKTGEQFLTKNGHARLAFGYCLRYFSQESPTRFVKIREEKPKVPKKVALGKAKPRITTFDATTLTQTIRIT